MHKNIHKILYLENSEKGLKGVENVKIVQYFHNPVIIITQFSFHPLSATKN